MGSRVYHWLFCGCRALCSGLCALWPQGWLEKWTTHDIEGRPRPGQDTACKKFLRACGGFTLGLLLTALYAVIVLFVKCHNTQFCLWSTIVLGTFLTLGMAFSATVRTIVFLMLPQLCSGKGTTIMIFITMALAVQGPGANTMENVHRVSDSLSCGLELTLNHTKELIEEAKQPLLRAVRFLKSIGTKLFSVSERTRRFFSSMLNGVKHIGRSLRNVWAFLSNMGEVCNEELETPYTKCIGIFNRGKEQCFKSLSILGFLCYIVDAFRPLCGLAKSVTLLCAIPSYIQTFVRKHLQTPLVSVLRYTKDQFQFNLTVIHEFGVMVNASKSVMQVATDIMEEIQEYMEPYRKALSLFTYSMICVILYYFIMAMRYRYMYLHDDEFDNVYITQRFIRIDVIRERSNQPTLLPLSSTEACDYIRPGSLALTRHERKGYTFAIINVFRSLLIVSVFLLVDYVIFWLLDMTVYHLQADVVAQAPVLVTLTASGKGFFREIFSRVVDAFNVMQNTNFTIFSKKCLIRPSPPDVTMYFLIGVLHGVAFLITIIEIYIQRLQRAICASYYPSREQERIVFLYNYLWTKRKKTTSTMMLSIRLKAAKMGNSSRWLMLAEKCPGFRRIAEIMGAKRQFCMACASVCTNTNSRAFLSCRTCNCRGFYCENCFRNMGDVCPICAAPDEDEEVDSSDEEWGVPPWRESPAPSEEDSGDTDYDYILESDD